MDRRSIIVALSATILAGGISAVIGSTAVPNDTVSFVLLFYGGIVALLLAAAGFFWSLIGSKKTNHEGHPSSFIKGNKLGSIDMEDVESDAVSFINVKKAKDLSARRVKHLPPSRDSA